MNDLKHYSFVEHHPEFNTSTNQKIKPWQSLPTGLQESRVSVLTQRHAYHLPSPHLQTYLVLAAHKRISYISS